MGRLGSNALHLDSTEDSFLTKYSGRLPIDGGAIVIPQTEEQKMAGVGDRLGMYIYIIVGELGPGYV